jgi:hypothetical protein
VGGRFAVVPSPRLPRVHAPIDSRDTLRSLRARCSGERDRRAPHPSLFSATEGSRSSLTPGRGRVTVVMVGAMIVGRITVSAILGMTCRWHPHHRSPRLSPGDEIGNFPRLDRRGLRGKGRRSALAVRGATGPRGPRPIRRVSPSGDDHDERRTPRDSSGPHRLSGNRVGAFPAHARARTGARVLPRRAPPGPVHGAEAPEEPAPAASSNRSPPPAKLPEVPGSTPSSGRTPPPLVPEIGHAAARVDSGPDRR